MINMENLLKTRTLLVAIREKMSIELYEKEFSLYNVYSADECFLMGTAAEVVPVREVDKRVIGSGEPGPITRKLFTAFHEYTQNNGMPIYEV